MEFLSGKRRGGCADMARRTNFDLLSIDAIRPAINRASRNAKNPRKMWAAARHVTAHRGSSGPRLRDANSPASRDAPPAQAQTTCGQRSKFRGKRRRFSDEPPLALHKLIDIFRLCLSRPIGVMYELKRLTWCFPICNKRYRHIHKSFKSEPQLLENPFLYFCLANAGFPSPVCLLPKQRIGASLLKRTVHPLLV